MRIIFCDSVFDSKQVEPDYESELNSAIQNGFECSLISFEELVSGNIRLALKQVQQATILTKAIYRGWMLTPKQYEVLYDNLKSKNIQLINSPKEYAHCHYLPNSFEKIKENTPRSNWTKDLKEEKIKEFTLVFGDKPIILKDFVKSEKHNWNDACYIPDASDFQNVKKVVDKFLELRGESLNEGIVFRQFEELEFLTEHSKSAMPLTKEFRLFFLNKKLIHILNYWDEGDYGDTQPELDAFLKIADTIESNFFTMDIAKKLNGEWIIMELGDGQVAGLPDNVDTVEFYKNILEN